METGCFGKTNVHDINKQKPKILILFHEKHSYEAPHYVFFSLLLLVAVS
jgi:hypothetical protein